MRRAFVALAVGLVLTGGQVAAAPAAMAKGPESARIEGGGRVVTVDWGAGSMKDLLEVTSFGDLWRAREVEEPVRRGPAYVVTYLIEEQEFRQVLYPLSSSGSVIYTAPRQWSYGATVRDGWTRAPVDLTEFLRGYGFSVPNEIRRPVWWPAAGLVVLLELLGWVS